MRTLLAKEHYQRAIERGNKYIELVYNIDHCEKSELVDYLDEAMDQLYWATQQCQDLAAILVAESDG